MAGTMLVDVDKLEHFTPGSDRGIRGMVVIDGVRFQQLTPAVFATVAQRVQKLREAAGEGRVSAEVMGAVEAEYASIREWALQAYGEQALREACGQSGGARRVEGVTNREGKAQKESNQTKQQTTAE
jgi:hypothetical protein